MRAFSKIKDIKKFCLTRWRLSRRTSVPVNVKDPYYKQFYPHQLAAVHFLTTHRTNLLCDEMGLGKTVSVCGALRKLDIRTGLIVCPATALYHWKEHLLRFLDKNLSISVLVGSKANFHEADFYVTTFKTVQLIPELQTLRKEALIIDEIHALKNPKAAVTRFVYGESRNGMRSSGIFPNFKYFVGLTGTLIPNNAGELYTHIRTLFPSAIRYMSYPEFREHFMHRVFQNGQEKFLGVKNAKYLEKILFSTLAMRRTTAQVWRDRPKLTIKLKFLEDFSESPWKNFDPKKNYVWDDCASAHHQNGQVKANLVLPFIKKLLGENEQLVIFAHHRHVFEILRSDLKEYSSETIDGSTSSYDRQEITKKFQTKKIRILYGSIKACGECLTLTSANVCVLVEFLWVPSANMQAIFRLYRLTQKKDVQAYVCAVKDSIDSYMCRRVFEKTLDIQQIVKDKKGRKMMKKKNEELKKSLRECQSVLLEKITKTTNQMFDKYLVCLDDSGQEKTAMKKQPVKAKKTVKKPDDDGKKARSEAKKYLLKIHKSADKAILSDILEVFGSTSWKSVSDEQYLQGGEACRYFYEGSTFDEALEKAGITSKEEKEEEEEEEEEDESLF